MTTENTQALMMKYFRVLSGAAGKETDNLRAKMAWFLSQEFFNSLSAMPASIQELSGCLEVSLQQQFPFCKKLAIEEVGLEGIKVIVQECYLKSANKGLLEEDSLNLCPVDPFLIFIFSRILSQNACLTSIQGTDQGCIMEFALNNRCSCSLD